MAYLKTINVRCFGATHLISVTERGELVFHDHSKQEIKSELVLAVMTEKPIECIRILKAWRYGYHEGYVPPELRIPAELKDLARRALGKRIKRAKIRESNIDLLTLPFRERIQIKVKPLAEQALLACSYRRSRSKWAGGNHDVFVEFGKPYIQGGSTKAWSRNRKWRGTNSFIRVRVDAVHWYVRVYKKDLAVVDGCFVLAHRGDDRYLVGRQSRGFDVKPWEARIVLGDDGKPHIVKWIRPAEIVLDENGKPHVK